MPTRKKQLQKSRFLSPHLGIADDFTAVYKKKQISVGISGSTTDPQTRPNTVAVIGAALGDEGKGRIIDNKLESFFANKSIKSAVVVRFQGGSNSGHTIEKDGLRVALHQVPSGVLYKKTLCIMDSGMVVHVEDLVTEIHYVEGLPGVGSIKNKLFLSQDAILVTDLDRAEEVMNNALQSNSSGGTGRGIGPSYAHYYDRMGLLVHQLMSPKWKETLGVQYDVYQKKMAGFGFKLSELLVPDFAVMKKMRKAEKRAVGSRKTFLDRLGSARAELLKRKTVVNTFLLHQEIYGDDSRAVLFEGAQSVALHAWLGTYPDVTASDTSVRGITTGTKFWKIQHVGQRLGVFKITYTSSVGKRQMPTEVELPKDLKELPKKVSKDVAWAAWVREFAHEYGTTTGRPRDILYLDLAMLSYSCRMGDINALAGTHLDVAREDFEIKVCTHYTNRKGKFIPYQPGLLYLENVVPHYISLPGWNGEAVTKAKKIKDLPENAMKFLSFIQRRLEVPIVCATTGASREQFLEFPGYRI